MLQANEGTEAGDRELLAFELRRLAAREGAKRRSAANSALDWVKAPLDAEQVMLRGNQPLSQWIISTDDVVRLCKSVGSRRTTAEHTWFLY